MNAKQEPQESLDKRKSLGIGRKDGRVILATDGKPWAAFDPLQAVVLAAKLFEQAAIEITNVAGQPINDALKQVEKEKKQ